MSNLKKIQTDYLIRRGIKEPTLEDYDVIEPIPENQLLKIVVKDNIGIPNDILADRYGVLPNKIKSIKRRLKKK